ncbi:MAG: ABC transporter permease [Verrucomicrobia bacterium]|nr:ABC transporter permease [Verrucomicrobiota bacterium]
MTDLRFACRQLLKNPGFTAVAVLTLALGIGANLALFTILYDQYLRPRGFQRPEQVWAIRPADTTGAARFFNLSAPYLEAIQSGNRAFAAIIGMSGMSARVRTKEGWDPVRLQFVSANYFDFLGVPPTLGRGFFREENGSPGAHPVAVISHRLWQQHLDGNPAILGKALTLKGEYPGSQTVEVVGVTAMDFDGLGRADVILPLGMESAFKPPASYSMFGRLADPVAPEAAAASLASTVQEVTRTLHSPTSTAGPAAGNNAGFTRVALLRAGWGSRDRAFALESLDDILKVNGLAAVSSLLLLLIALANLASLILARGFARRRVLATQRALGASRWTLMRQPLWEGLILSLAGTFAALLMMAVLGGVEPRFIAGVFNPGAQVSLHPDFRVVGIAALGSLVAATGASLFPTLWVTRPDLVSSLKEIAADRSGQGLWSWQKVLVVGQVSGSLVLLASACLCQRAIRAQVRSDTGFPTDHLIVAQVGIEDSLRATFQPGDGNFREQYVRYLEQNAPAACEELRQRLASLPGVSSVGVLGRSPFVGGPQEVVTTRLAGHPGVEQKFWMDRTGPAAFRTLGISLVAGREISAEDLTGQRRVALVNERFVQTFWPDRGALGRQIYDETWNEAYEVIGVVRDARLVSPADPALPTAFFHGLPAALNPAFLVRTRTAPESLIKPIQTALSGKDPWLQGSRVLPVEQVRLERLSRERQITTLLGAMTALAMLLTGLGIYAVISFLVAQRTRDIGIRMAVGARRLDVLFLVLGVGARFALAGIAVGLPLTLGASFALQRVVVWVVPFDPAMWLLAALGIGAVILMACWLPARRASRVDPMVALRSE